jgi:hypothetical protein
MNADDSMSIASSDLRKNDTSQPSALSKNISGNSISTFSIQEEDELYRSARKTDYSK